MINILVIGSGGRESAICKKLYDENNSHNIFFLPGNASYENIKIVDIDIKDFEAIKEFCKKEKIETVIIGPDDSLADGIVDFLQSEDLFVFGPTKDCAMLESSKTFSKELMEKYDIPTAAYKDFDKADSALSYVKTAPHPIVIKADGLAKGKGVIISTTVQESIKAIEEIMNDKIFGDAGNKIIIEEFLEGREVSILCFCDGKNILPMDSVKDYKKIGENDTGENTGGMGTISPVPYYTKTIQDDVNKNIVYKSMEAIKSEGLNFIGVLFIGLILTKDGPKVLEYNTRFGDPETQAILPRLNNNLLDIITACKTQTLDSVTLNWKKESSVCVVVASGGYPHEFETNFEITGLENISSNSYISMAGVKSSNGKLLTNGGRVLGITSLGETLEDATKNTYNEIEKIKFNNIYFRKDIGGY